MASQKTNDLHAAEKRLLQVTAELSHTIARRGDKLAKKMKYGDLGGMDAIHRYLIDKHHWLPDQVRRLTVDEIQLLLAGDPNF